MQNILFANLSPLMFSGLASSAKGGDNYSVINNIDGSAFSSFLKGQGQFSGPEDLSVLSDGQLLPGPGNLLPLQQAAKPEQSEQQMLHGQLAFIDVNHPANFPEALPDPVQDHDRPSFFVNGNADLKIDQPTDQWSNAISNLVNVSAKSEKTPDKNSDSLPVDTGRNRILPGSPGRQTPFVSASRPSVETPTEDEPSGELESRPDPSLVMQANNTGNDDRIAVQTPEKDLKRLLAGLSSGTNNSSPSRLIKTSEYSLADPESMNEPDNENLISGGLIINSDRNPGNNAVVIPAITAGKVRIPGVNQGTSSEKRNSDDAFTEGLKTDSILGDNTEVTESGKNRDTMRSVVTFPQSASNGNNTVFNGQIIKQLKWMVSNNIRTAEVKLEPASLGAIELKVSLEANSTNITFITSTQTVKEALDSASAYIRQEFQDSDEVNVDINLAQDSEAFGQNGDSDSGEMRDENRRNLYNEDSQSRELHISHNGLINIYA